MVATPSLPADLAAALDGEFADLVTSKLAKGKPIHVGSQNPKIVGERFLAACKDEVVRFHKGVSYRYVPNGGYYKEQDKEAFQADVLRFVQSLYEEQTTALRQHLPEQYHRLVRPRPIKGPFLSDAIASIKAATIVVADDIPVWLGEGAPGRLLCMKNGIIDLDELVKTGRSTLRPHTPDYFTVVALPFEYNANASCPQWDAFLEQMLEADAERVSVIQEWFGFCIGQDIALHKFLLMEGSGSNGKTTVVEVLKTMLGDSNVSHLPLEMFAERFQLMVTYGKLLNIAPEALQLNRKTEAMVKAYVGGDSITSDRKNLGHITFRPTAKLLVMTNERPKVSDRSDGFWRRMMVLPFRVTAVDADKAHLYPNAPVKDPELPNRLKAELSGVFNWAVVGLRRLLKAKRFSTSTVMADAIETAKAEDNPIRRFANAYLTPSSNGHVEVAAVYDTYKRWCEQQGEVVENQIVFGKALRQVVMVEKGQNRHRGRRVETYKGITMLPIA